MDSYGLPMVGVNGWLPNGMKVFYNIPIRNPETAFEEALAFTDALLAKGFRQTEPGLEEGELKESISVVSRRNKSNDDGTNTPVLDLFVNNDKMKHRYMAVYLNTTEDEKAFESASGIKVASIPLNPTKAPVERDDAQFALKVKPFNVIYKNNPNYDENSPDKKPKRLFVRWDGINTQSDLQNGQNAGTPPDASKNGNSEHSDAWDKPAVEKFVAHYAGKLTTDQLLTALHVTRFGEWKHGGGMAYAAADGFLKSAQETF